MKIILGGNKHTIPFRRQRLDIDEMLPESHSSHQTLVQQLAYIKEPYIIDIVKFSNTIVTKTHPCAEEMILHFYFLQE